MLTEKEVEEILCKVNLFKVKKIQTKSERFATLKKNIELSNLE